MVLLHSLTHERSRTDEQSIGFGGASPAAANSLQLSGIEVVHVRHGLRDDAADVEPVADLTDRMGIPLHVEQLAWDESSESTAEQARRLRYEVLGRYAADRDAVVVTAHTRDDQVETILHRLLRGTGLAGLRGMASPSERRLADGRSFSLVRPLLSISRREIDAYAAAVGLAFVDDPSNESPHYTRNRLRHEVLPLLATINPEAGAAVLRLSEQASQAASVVAAAAAGLRAECPPIGSSANAWTVPATVLQRWASSPLATELVRAEVLRQLWKAAGWPEQRMTASHWQSLATLTGTAARGGLDVPYATARRDRDGLHLVRRGTAG